MQKLFYQESGSGPLLLLLHGFPDISDVWAGQVESLATAFHVVAPDLRGYGRSPRPTAVEAYRVEALVEDLLGLIAERPCFIVGHDWGGLLAWTLGALRPDLVSKLAILNSPHPQALWRQILTNPRQTWRSKYMFFFQLPWLPEQMIMRDTRRWMQSLHRQSRGGYLDRAVQAMAQPGAASAALNYYRAAFRYKSRPLAPIEVPTSLIWGTRDRALGTASALASAKYVQGPLQLHLWPDAGHWPQLDQPDRTNQTLGNFLRG